MLEIIKRDKAGRVLALPNQTPGVLQAVGLTRAQVDFELWAIDARGVKYGGAQAANLAWYELGGVWRLLSYFYTIQPFKWIEDRVYRWIAEHRPFMSRLFSSVPECEKPDVKCE